MSSFSGESVAQSFTNTNLLPYFDYLPDELLIEILHRLPQNLVIRTRCVSKRWLVLTSSNNFVERYIEYKACLPNSKPPFALLYVNPSCRTSPHRCAYSENPLFELPGFSLNFLPPTRYPVYILGSSTGLLLCSSSSCNNYYVCNPLTKQWFTIPLSPGHNYFYFNSIGFISKSTNSSCSFRIVHILFNATSTRELEIYDSESRQWSKTILNKSFRFDIPPIQYEAIACNQLLHWRNTWRYIFVYDPYNGGDSCKIINVPRCEFLPHKSTMCVFNDRLWYIKWDPENFRIWELEDYDTEKWTLVQEFCFNLMDTENQKSSNYNFCSVVLHPFDENIVLSQRGYELIRYNTHLKQRATVDTNIASHPVTWSPFTLPWWPVAMPLHHPVQLCVQPCRLQPRKKGHFSHKGFLKLLKNIKFCNSER